MTVRPGAERTGPGEGSPTTLEEVSHLFARVIASPGAVRLALRTSRRPRNPWRQGACLVLAGAVVRWLGQDGAEVWELAGEHVLVKVGGLVIDGGGIAPVNEMLKVWAGDGGLGDCAVDGMHRSSLAEAERKGYEFDDWASERLAALLSKAIPRDAALEAMSSCGQPR